MTLQPMFRRFLALLAAILLLAGAWEGISGGAQQWSQSSTTGQRLQTASQIVYGVFAIATLVTAFTWRQLQLLANVLFMVGVMAAAGLAARVWGGATFMASALSGLAGLAIAGVIVWMLRTGAAVTPTNLEKRT